MTKDEIPTVNDEAIAVVDLSHLTTEIADLVRQVLHKHVSMLAKSQFELPPTNYIQADIQLNNNVLSQCLRCAHSPIPAHLLNEVETILSYASLYKGESSFKQMTTPQYSMPYWCQGKVLENYACC